MVGWREIRAGRGFSRRVLPVQSQTRDKYVQVLSIADALLSATARKDPHNPSNHRILIASSSSRARA